MDHFPSTENTQPWWADVAHLRDDDAPSAVATVRSDARPSAVRFQDDAPIARPRRSDADRERAARPHGRSRAPRSRRPERTPSDWFAQEAGSASRRSAPRPDTSRPSRPRATLVDVAPDHAMLSRPIAVRRAPGERPTVTITGRPDAALPPRVAEPKTVRGRRTREQATSLVASPDRMILWAVALGVLMILASIGTASADAAALLP